MKKYMIVLLLVMLTIVACGKKEEKASEDPVMESTGVLINTSKDKKDNKLAINYNPSDNKKLILIDLNGINISNLSERISAVLEEMFFETGEISINLNTIDKLGTGISIRNGGEWIYFDIWTICTAPESEEAVGNTRKINQNENISVWVREDDAGKTTAASYYICYQNGGETVDTNKIGDYLPKNGYKGVSLGLPYLSELSEEELLETVAFLTGKINAIRYVTVTNNSFTEANDDATEETISLNEYHFLNDIITTKISKEIGLDFDSKLYIGAIYEKGYLYDMGKIVYTVYHQKAINCNFSNYNRDIKEKYNIYVPDKLTNLDIGKAQLYICRENSNSSTAKYNQTTLLITGEEEILPYEDVIEIIKKDFNLK